MCLPESRTPKDLIDTASLVQARMAETIIGIKKTYRRIEGVMTYIDDSLQQFFNMDQAHVHVFQLRLQVGEVHEGFFRCLISLH